MSDAKDLIAVAREHFATPGDEIANILILWIAPRSGRIVVSQFMKDSEGTAILESDPIARPPFDGRWLWTDAAGVDQPAPALFRGLFSVNTPHVAALEPAYRDLANAMRRGYLDYGGAFENLLDAARAWEKAQPTAR